MRLDSVGHYMLVLTWYSNPGSKLLALLASCVILHRQRDWRWGIICLSYLLLSLVALNGIVFYAPVSVPTADSFEMTFFGVFSWSTETAAPLLSGIMLLWWALALPRRSRGHRGTLSSSPLAVESIGQTAPKDPQDPPQGLSVQNSSCGTPPEEKAKKRFPATALVPGLAAWLPIIIAFVALVWVVESTVGAYMELPTEKELRHMAFYCLLWAFVATAAALISMIVRLAVLFRTSTRENRRVWRNARALGCGAATACVVLLLVNLVYQAAQPREMRLDFVIDLQKGAGATVGVWFLTVTFNSLWSGLRRKVAAESAFKGCSRDSESSTADPADNR